MSCQGFLSRRYQLDYATDRYNFNMYWTVVNETGDTVVGPVNLTNNTTWGIPGAVGVPIFSSPRIIGAGDDRFLLAWTRQHITYAGSLVEIYYSVRSSNGAVVKPVTRLVEATRGIDEHDAPALASLQGDRVLLSWSRRATDSQILYTVLDSSGTLLRPPASLSMGDRIVDWWNADVVQLANGAIVAVWEAWGCLPDEWTSRIRVAVLDADYNPVAEPLCLIPLQGLSFGDSKASVVAVAPNRAAITWQGDSMAPPNHLYYAEVNSWGIVTTAPTIGLTNSHPLWRALWNGTDGYTSASVTWEPPDGVDSAVALRDMALGMPLDGITQLHVRLTGRGRLPATGVTLRAVVDPRLAYLDDNSGVTPVVSGNVLTWHLPDLRLYDIREFTIRLQNAGGEPGENLTVQLELHADQPDLQPADNSVSVSLQLYVPVYLPLLAR